MRYTSKLILNWTEYEFGTGWGWGWWTPWENTLLYMPFSEDILDHSWNNVTFTTYWTAPVIQDWVSVWDWTGFLYTSPLTPASHVFTAQCWVNIAITTGVWWLSDDSHSPYKWWNSKPSNNKWRIEIPETSTSVYSTTTLSEMLDNWYLVTLVWNNNYAYLYINWELEISSAGGFTSWTYAFSIGKNIFKNDDIAISSIFQWKMSELIFEDKAWTSQEISNYFNSTKSLYWIS